MKTKIITGSILAVIVLLLLWWDNVNAWVIIATIASVVGYFEACKLYEQAMLHALTEAAAANKSPEATALAEAAAANKSPEASGVYAKYLGAVFIICAGIYMLAEPAYPISLALSITLLLASLSALAARDFGASLAMLYAGCGIACLLDIYMYRGSSYLLWLILCVCLCDIFAYFAGKAYGKTHFSASSPNKTLEGCLAGLIAASLLGGIYAGFMLDMPWSLAFGYSLLLAIFGIFGDLFESRIKRLAQVKDSGWIFPAHGGVLDRLDALIFAGFVVRILL